MEIYGDRLTVGCLTLTQEVKVRFLLPVLKENKTANGPVAQRQRQLSYKQSIGGSSPPRTTLQMYIRRPSLSDRDFENASEVHDIG